MSRKVTSLSFRNRMWRKGTAWTEKETELFYGEHRFHYSSIEFAFSHTSEIFLREDINSTLLGCVQIIAAKKI